MVKYHNFGLLFCPAFFREIFMTKIVDVVCPHNVLMLTHASKEPKKLLLKSK
jgi:hypothetical protein